MSKVTKRFVYSIKSPEKAEAIYWDDELKGFAVGVWPSGDINVILRSRPAAIALRLTPRYLAPG